MGGKNQTQTTNSSQSYTPTGLNQLQDIWNKVQGVASTPYTPYGGQLTAGLDPTQQAGINTINAAQGTAQPYFDQASQYAKQGAASIDPSQIQKYLSPYTQNVVDATQRQFADNNAQQQQQVVGNAALKGALGGDRVGVAQAELARQQKLAQDPTIAGLYNQGYTQALGAAQQDRAAAAQGAYTFGALAPAVQNTAISGGNAQLGAGAVAQGTTQAGLSADYQKYLQQQAFPYQQAQFLTQYGVPTITAMGGSQTGQSQTTQPGPSPWGQIAGLGVSALGAFSDERVKKNIDEIGKTFDGQPIYRFEYKGSDRPQIGLMAQDVERTKPEAVGEVGGIKTVNYRTATEDAARKGKFARGGAVDYLSVPGFIPDSDIKLSDMTQKMSPMQAPQFSQQGQVGGGMPSSQSMKDMTAGFKSLSGMFGGSGDVSQGTIGGTGLEGFGGLYSVGGTVMPSPSIQGYALGGDIDGPLSFADRSLPVQEAIASGAFDPQGQNNTPFSRAPEFTPSPIAGPAPLPTARPDNIQPTMMADDGQMPVSPMAASPRAPMQLAANDGTTMDLSAREKPKSESTYGGFNPLGLSDDARTGLIAAGLGMAASRSPFALQAVGEGGLQGLSTYVGQKKERGDREIQKQRVDQEAARLAQQASQFATTSGETKRYHDILDQQRKDAAEERRTRTGYMRNADGTMTPIQGGPADPVQIAAVAKAKQTGGLLPDDTADFLAERVLAGDAKALIGLGRGAQGAENITKIQTLAARKAAERGMSPQDVLAKVAEQSGLTAQQRTFGTQVARMAVNSTEAQGAIELGREASKLVPRGNWVPVTKAIQAFQAGTSDPNLAKFGAANLAIINTYSRAISPTGVPTVHDKEHAERLLSTAIGPDAYNAVLDQMNKEIEIAHAAPLKAKQEMENIRKSGQTKPGVAPAVAPAALPKRVKQGGHTYEQQPDGSMKAID